MQDHFKSQTRYASRRLWILVGVGVSLLLILAIRTALLSQAPAAQVEAAAVEHALSEPAAVDAVTEVLAVVAAASESEVLTASDELLTSSQTQVADLPSDNCIACHTNESQLRALAVEPEKVYSELAAGEG